MADPLNPPLHPQYSPATQDSQIIIRFMGNTARVGGFGTMGEVDPFQLLAASVWLKRQADQMLNAQEMAAVRKGILTPDQAGAGGIPR